MALASLRRIGAPISLLSKHQLFRPTSSVSAATWHSAKVFDWIVRLFAINFDGNKREVVGLTGQTLLRALANAGLASHRLEEIEACSAECEVHIAQERIWSGRWIRKFLLVVAIAIFWTHLMQCIAFVKAYKINPLIHAPVYCFLIPALLTFCIYKTSSI